MDLAASTNVPWSTTLTLAGTALLAGAALHMQLRPAPGSPYVELDLSTGNGRLTVADPAARTCALHVGADAMLAVPPGTYVFDLVVAPAAGDRAIGASGTVTVAQGITFD